MSGNTGTSSSTVRAATGALRRGERGATVGVVAVGGAKGAKDTVALGGHSVSSMLSAIPHSVVPVEELLVPSVFVGQQQRRSTSGCRRANVLVFHQRTGGCSARYVWITLTFMTVNPGWSPRGRFVHSVAVTKPEIRGDQSHSGRSSAAAGRSQLGCILKVGVHLQVGLCLLAKDVHFVLVETLVAAELQLLLTVLEIHVVDRVPDVFAPVANFVLFERGTATLRKAKLTAEGLLA